MGHYRFYSWWCNRRLYNLWNRLHGSIMNHNLNSHKTINLLQISAYNSELFIILWFFICISETVSISLMLTLMVFFMSSLLFKRLSHSYTQSNYNRIIQYPFLLQISLWIISLLIGFLLTYALYFAGHSGFAQLYERLLI